MNRSEKISPQAWWTLVAVSLGTFMLLLDITIVVVALPDIQKALGAGFDDVQWTVDAYSLSLASLLLASGSIADLYGRRRAFAAGLVIFTGASLLCGLARSPEMLIAFRAVQGIGGATIFATSLALLAQTFHGKARGVAFGVWGAVVSISTAAGPLLGGVLTTGIGWRWIFFVNVPIGIVAVLVTLRFVAESRPPHARKVDVPGFVVFTLGLVSLVYGLIRANEHGWTNTVSLVAFGVAAVLLVSFPFVERAVRQPMFDFSLFRKPTFVGGSIAAFAMNGSLFAMLLYFTLYLQEVLGYSALQTGLRLAIITGATLFTAIPAGRLSAHVPVRWLIGPGLLMVGAGLLLMRGLDASSDWTHLIPGFLVAGLGSGLVNPPLASTAVGVVEPRFAGMASGINSTFRQVGIATSVAALGSILATHTNGATGPAARDAFVTGLNEILLIAGILAIVGGALAIPLIRRQDFHVHVPEGEAGGPGASTNPEGAASAAGSAAG
ncbi:MAG TPA: MFS transporter [Solirubrobacterales bacterium]|nr:MFS transporter [Solirubrobacterales bacterium]